MKRLLKILLSLLFISGCNKTDTYKSINMDEAFKMMNDINDYIILDVRTYEEYKDGHIPNSINYPNEDIDDKILNVLPNKDQYIFVYCRSGNRSKQASEKLFNMGYKNTIEFGGINSYKGEIVKGDN